MLSERRRNVLGEIFAAPPILRPCDVFDRTRSESESMLSRRLTRVMVDDEDRIADVGRPPHRCREVIGVVQSVEETKKRESLAPQILSEILHSEHRDALDLSCELPTRVAVLHAAKTPSGQRGVDHDVCRQTSTPDITLREQAVSFPSYPKRLEPIRDRMQERAPTSSPVEVRLSPAAHETSPQHVPRCRRCCTADDVALEGAAKLRKSRRRSDALDDDLPEIEGCAIAAAGRVEQRVLEVLPTHLVDGGSIEM